MAFRILAGLQRESSNIDHWFGITCSITSVSVPNENRDTTLISEGLLYVLHDSMVHLRTVAQIVLI